jgi:hypothetical protein
MNENHKKQNQNCHCRHNSNSKKNQNQQSKSFKNKEKENDKKVPMKYETKRAKASETIELELDIDNKSDKVKLTMFEDGTDEQFLKLVKEFKNMTDYELWEQDNGAKAIYRLPSMGGAARDLWDQVNIIDEEEEMRDEITFENH